MDKNRMIFSKNPNESLIFAENPLSSNQHLYHSKIHPFYERVAKNQLRVNQRKKEKY